MKTMSRDAVILLMHICCVSAGVLEYRALINSLADNCTAEDNVKDHLRRGSLSLTSTQLNVFPCTPYSCVEKTTSVHRLRACDVSVVGAIGDSLTAGMGAGAFTILGLLTQWRGLAWSIGGDPPIEDVLTLPNMLRKYNPNLFGFSLATGSVMSQNSNLNVADPGAKSGDALGQARLLIDRVKADTSIDFANHWKVITIFIGNNDLCDYCDDKSEFGPTRFAENIRVTLDLLHASLPRAFINLVLTLSISEVQHLNEGLVCTAAHAISCRCAAFPVSSESRQELINVQNEYRRLLEELVNSGRYDTRDDFTVVIQPLFVDTKPPPMPDNPSELDLSYFAPDCFHFSAKGQASSAKALWSNMVEAVGQKRTSWDPAVPVACPTPTTYFGTNLNTQPQSALLGSQRNQDPDGSTSEINGHSGTVIVGIFAGVALIMLFMSCITIVLRYRKKAVARTKMESGLGSQEDHLIQSRSRVPVYRSISER